MIPLLLAGLSVIPWSIALVWLFPVKDRKKTALIIIFAMLAGHLTTEILQFIHPVLWPETDKAVRSHILTQTLHIAFIQAGMMEETFKIAFILLTSRILAWKNGLWQKEAVLAGGFVAIGFSLTENTGYFSIAREDVLWMTFIVRTIHSVNIHLLINLCFALFLLKSNSSERPLLLILFAFLLAVTQHGVVDFFLIPSVRIGNWLAAAMFTGVWVWVVNDFRKYVIQAQQSDVLPP